MVVVVRTEGGCKEWMRGELSDMPLIKIDRSEELGEIEEKRTREHISKRPAALEKG